MCVCIHTHSPTFQLPVKIDETHSNTIIFPSVENNTSRQQHVPWKTSSIPTHPTPNVKKSICEYTVKKQTANIRAHVHTLRTVYSQTYTLASKKKPSTPKNFLDTLTSVDTFIWELIKAGIVKLMPFRTLKMVDGALTKSVYLLHVARQVTPQVKSSVTCDVIWSHVKWRVTCYVTWLATWRDVTWRDIASQDMSLRFEICK